MSTITADQLQAERDALAATVQRVRELHRPNDHFPYYCVTCRSALPCSTVRAMDGAAASSTSDPMKGT